VKEEQYMTDLEIRTMENGTAVLPGAAIDAFETGLSGRVVHRNDPDYEEHRAIWNGMIDKKPALIVRCGSVDDVVASVNLARENGLLLAVHGGGHNVAGTALCDGGLMVDLSMMNEVEVDPDACRARAEAGAIIADLDAATQRYGLATPMGVVSETGIAGLTLGGGIGWLRRKHGLSCDNLISADVVTADGRLLKASETEHPDLLWGIRGGGGNFGIVTSFEYQLHPVGPDVMFVFALYRGSQRREALRAYRDYCAAAPDEVSSWAISGTVPATEDFPEEIHGEPYLNIGACYAGSVEKGRRIMQPLREFGEPMVDFSGPMLYTDVQVFLDEDYPDGFHYYWKSLYLESLGDDVIDGVVTWSDRRPSLLSTVDVWHMGGAVSRFSAADAAVGNREAPYLLGVEANWEPSQDDDANVAWARACVEDMRTFSKGGQYLNFPGFHEREDETMRTTFGNQYERLVALKKKFDPSNLFRLNHNIKPDANLNR
jgi:FAD/FMN-containing dehydrogenase